MESEAHPTHPSIFPFETHRPIFPPHCFQKKQGGVRRSRPGPGGVSLYTRHPDEKKKKKKLMPTFCARSCGVLPFKRVATETNRRHECFCASLSQKDTPVFRTFLVWFWASHPARKYERPPSFYENAIAFPRSIKKREREGKRIKHSVGRTPWAVNCAL